MYHFMLISANEWMMLMLKQCKCNYASLTLGGVTIPALQDRDVSDLDKVLDEIFFSSSETITAVLKTVSHNTMDGSPSTLQSSCGQPVSGSAERPICFIFK